MAKKKRKKKSWYKELDSLLRQAIIKRDGKCAKCGRVYDPQKPQAFHVSHVKPKGRYPGLRYDTCNVMLLCYHCHIHWWHKDPIAAAKWFDEEFELRAWDLKGQIHNGDYLKPYDFEVTREILKQKIKEYSE